MTAIKTNFGAGGANVNPGHGNPDLATTLREIADDLAELRTQFIALLAKLDGDGGITDTDYESSLTPSALNTTKG
jgi:hypothetical protein